MHFTPSQKAAFAREYLGSGMTQKQFCARYDNRFAPRSLRSWLHSYAQPKTAAKQARVIIKNAIDDLQAILHGIEAAIQFQDVVPGLTCDGGREAAASCRWAGEAEVIDGDDLPVAAAECQEALAESSGADVQAKIEGEPTVSAAVVSQPRSCAIPVPHPHTRSVGPAGRKSFFSEFD